MLTMPVQYGVQLQIAYVDSGGNPAEIDGAVVWASSDENLATVNVNPDDTTMCSVVTGTAVGQVQITATADVDLGAGVRSLVTLCDINVIAGEAVAGTITPVGEPAPIAPQPVKKK